MSNTNTTEAMQILHYYMANTTEAKNAIKKLEELSDLLFDTNKDKQQSKYKILLTRLARLFTIMFPEGEIPSRFDVPKCYTAFCIAMKELNYYEETKNNKAFWSQY